jgi:hypothetical protein
VRTGAQSSLDLKERRWAILRLFLGTVQIVGSTASLVLLILTGVNVWSLSGVVVTGLFTTVSVLLFGARKGRGARRNDG